MLSNDEDNPDIEIPVTFTVTPEDENTSPEIISQTPASALTLQSREPVCFEVGLEDAEGDELTCQWFTGR